MATFPVLAADVSEAKKEKSGEELHEVEKDGGEGSLFEEIVVRSRQPFPAAEDDEAASSTTVTREQFDQPDANLADVLDRQPGVRVGKQGGLGAFSTLSIRGSTGEQVLILLDGIPLNSAEGGPVDLSTLPLGNVERIEIYRGSSPTIFGGGAIGGVINIKTRSPEKRNLTVEGGGGSFKTRMVRSFLAEAHERFEFALGMEYHGSEGDFPYTNDQGTAWDDSDDSEERRKHNRFDMVNLLAKGRVRLFEDADLTVTDFLFWRERELPGFALFEARESKLIQVRNLSAIQFTLKRLGGKKINWRTMAYFSYSLTEFSDPLGEMGLGKHDTHDRSFTPGGGSYAKFPVTSWLKATLSAEYRYEKLKAEDERSTISKPDTFRHFLTGAGELDFEIEAIETSLLPSARLEYAESKLGEIKGAGVSIPESDAVSEFAPSYRFAIVNRLIPYTLLKFNAGHYSRMPSLFELFGDTGYVSGSPELLPEEGWNFDGGIVHEANWLPYPHLLQMEAYGFYRRVENLIQFVKTNQFFKAQNVDSARIFGFEAGACMDLWRHLVFRGNYTYMDSRNTGKIRARKNKVLPLKPKTQWFTHTELYWGKGIWVPKAGIFMEMEWTAGSFMDNANLVAAPARFFLSLGQYVSIYKERVTLKVIGRNLTDQKVNDLAGYPLPGRSFFGSVSVRFW